LPAPDAGGGDRDAGEFGDVEGRVAGV
jgi:hypothetical protein